MRAPIIYVGILTRKAITFTFNQEYVMVEDGAFLKGEQRAILIDGKIVFNGKMYNQLFFEPTSPDATFDLQAVTIGVDFHWQQQEDQRFQGALEITPFEIPEGWMWVRLGHLCNIINGFTPSRSNPDFWNGSIPWFTIDDIRQQGRFISHTAQYITNKALSRGTQRLIPPETVLLCCTASVGEYAYTKIALTTNQQFNALVIQEENTHLIWSMYLYVFAQTLKPQIIEGAGKTTFNFLSVDKLKEFLVPVPPFDEQKRIVAKIEELLPLVDRYEQAWTKLEDFNRRFPEDMKKSILQQAIQGKLVEQRPEEGTAQELYAQIQAEKQRLIKEGKLKKEKPLPEITEDEKPFEIPEGWMWVRFGAVIDMLSGYAFKSQDFKKEGRYRLLRGINLGVNTIRWDDTVYLNEIPNKLSAYKLSIGDLLLGLDRPWISEGIRVGIFNDSQDTFLVQRVLRIREIGAITNKYAALILRSALFMTTVASQTTGISVPHISPSQVSDMAIPLPPLAEQKRIVARLEELLPLCEKLRNNN